MSFDTRSTMKRVMQMSPDLQFARASDSVKADLSKTSRVLQGSGLQMQTGRNLETEQRAILRRMSRFNMKGDL